MKHHTGLTMGSRLLKETENFRGREKRSTFIEHLIRLGLKTLDAEKPAEGFARKLDPI